MGSNSASSGGGGNSNKTSTPFGTSVGTKTKTRFGYTKPPKTAREGVVDYVKSGGAVGAILRDLKKFTKPSAKQIEDRKLPFGDRNQYHKIGIINNANKGNREFFTNRVLKGTEKVNFGSLNSTEQENQYKGYMEKRLSGETDAIGRTKVQGTGGDPSNLQNKVVKAPVVTEIPKVVAPTTAEVSQATATDATSTMSAEDAIKKADDIILRKKKTKAQGRSATILSSSRGVRSDEGLTLGKRSLLGS
tara:strand:- start:72 stop:812 length:741 start_codon:yes stop_codon:yes gene_type:complete